ncbi:MAG: DNA double-strand break repair helicase HerA [Metallosphaera javensis (ex Sakai et al. 2022)]|nr:MAG: DNA double-strand break repair helicase HerA [Metallosphaera javensis (ex Sakai et al. 2022)]
MWSRLPPILLILIGLMILLYPIFHFHLLYIIIAFIPVLLFIVIFRFKKTTLLTSKIIDKQNVFEIQSNNHTYSGIILKLNGKIELNKDNINFQKELESLMETLGRRDVGFEYYVVTSLSKKKTSSSLILLRECNNCIEEILQEVQNIRNISNAVAPHIQLDVTSSSNSAIPLPRGWGELSFAKVYERVIDSPKNTLLLNEYDVDLGYMKTDVAEIKTGISIRDLTRHIAIFGTTGSGKSTTATLLAKKLIKKGISITILDWHGEHVGKISTLKVANKESPVRINPLKLGDIEEVVEIMGDVLRLTDPQRFLLYSILLKMRRANRFDMKMLISILRNIEESSNWMREVKYGLLRKIYLLFTKEAKLIFDDKVDNVEVKEGLFNTIIDLSFIRNIRLRRIYGLMIIKVISDYFMREKPMSTSLLMIEEAHNFFAHDNDFLEKLISEVRKYGLGLCIISQSPSSISPEVLKNTNIKIIHSIKSDTDKRILAESLSLTPSLYDSLDKLDVGEALLSAPNVRIPVLVKIRETE